MRTGQPPRVEDSIANDGGSIEIDPEESVNLEVGMRSELFRGLNIDATYFRDDFSNLIAVGPIAGGDNPLAQGEALFEGLEALTRIDSGRMYNKPWSIYSHVAFTWVPVAERPSFRSRRGLRCRATPRATASLMRRNISSRRASACLRRRDARRAPLRSPRPHRLRRRKLLSRR